MRFLIRTFLFLFLATSASTGIAQTPDPFVPQSPLTFPATLENANKIGLRFEQTIRSGSGLSDVRLVYLEHKEGGSYLFDNDPTPFVNHPNTALRMPEFLWEMRLTRQSSPTEITLDPNDSTTSIQAYHSFGYNFEPSLLFRWPNIVVDASNTLCVELAVSLGAGDSVSRWYGRASWQTPGGGVRIEEFDFPITCFVPPGTRHKGENSYEALKRIRLLIPSNFLFAPVITPNMSAKSFFDSQGETCVTDRKYKHPNPGFGPGDGVAQHLQFATLYDGDEADSAGFRRMLYFGTEDEKGYYKHFRYQGYGSYSEGTEEDPWTLRFGWRATHYPPYADMLGSKLPTTWNNTYGSPYPTVLGALRALDDAFWYDAANYYRSFVEAKGLGGPPLDQNDKIGLSKGPSVWGLFNSTTGVGGEATYRSYLDLMRAFKKVVENEYVSNDAAIMHWQTYLQNQSEVKNPAYPVGSDVDPAATQIISEALNEYNIRTSLYTHPGRTLRNGTWWNSFFSPNAETFDKDGLPTGCSFTAQWAMFDFGGPESWTIFPQKMYPDLASSLGATGVYLDTISGQGAELSYDPPSPYTPTHIAHGGNYWIQGKIKAVDNIRTAMQLNSPFATPLEPDVDVTVVSEANMEYLAGHLDVTSQGYDWPPYYLLLAEDTLLEDTGLPPESTTWCPPLWNTVYHEWVPTGERVIPFTNVGLETNGNYNNNPGMTSDELLDLYSYFYSVFYCEGTKPAVFTYLKQFDSPLVTLDEYGELEVDTTIDPEKVGLKIAGMIRTLYASLRDDFAGQFLLTGRLLRPLQIDYESTGSEVDMMNNPAEPCEKTNNAYALATYPCLLRFSDHRRAAAQRTFDVPSVLHSMWRSQTTGKLGLVLVNWTANEASWSGVFNPELYGIQAGQPYWAGRLNLGGPTTYLGLFNGPIEIHANPGSTSGSDLYLGKIPAHSVMVIMFQ